jgi:16S rRNA processing protein RimM
MAPAVVLAVQERGKGRAAVEIEGVGTIEQAEALRGQRLFRPAGAAPRLPEGRFYAFELIGMRVVTAKGEEIGLVEEIRQTGGADLLVVRGGGRERLIPFARSICPRVAPAEGVIEIDPPEGLLELDEV